jgi:drug/metabolite transporter (DMT)-like permease
VASGKSIPLRGTWATHAALLVVQFAFASQAVEAKLAMMPRAAGGEEIFPEALAMIRMLGGALFFQAIARVRATQGVAIGRADHVRLAGLSIIGIALNQTLFLLGLRWTTPFSASILGATIPIFAAALAVLFGKERLSWRTVLGLSLALLGALSLVGHGSLDRGAILVALNSLSYAAYVVLSRDVVLRVGPLRSIAWIFTYAALLFAPFGLRPLLVQLPALTPRGWGFTLYILALPTITAYLLNAWALARSSATLVTVYIYLQPVLAALLAWAQLGYGVSSRAGLAAVLILAGLSVVASRRPVPPPSAEQRAELP